MYYLYVLLNSSRRHYIGLSKNPERRLAKHNSGATRSTKPFRPWQIAYSEAFHSKTEARKRELFLKRTARARNDIFATIDKNGPIV